MSLFARKTELFDWSRGVQHWRYASGDRDEVFNSQTYQHAALKRSSLADTQEPAKNRLDVTAPLSLPLLELYAGGSVPMEVIHLTVYQMRNNLVSIVWKGVLTNPTFSGRDVVLHHSPPSAAASALGMTQPWSKTCHKPLYSTGLGACNASRTAMRVDGTLTSVTGAVIQCAAAAGKPDGWFTRGWVQWQAGLATERRAIVNHVGDTLTLLMPMSAPVGTAVVLMPGCDQLATTCRDKFNNIVNYGGMAWLPDKNPFGTDPIY